MVFLCANILNYLNSSYYPHLAQISEDGGDLELKS